MYAKKTLLRNLVFALILVSGSAMAGLPYGICSDLTSCQAAAATGNMTAEYNLGLIYDNGIGTKPDYTLAAQWYQKAATQGLSVAQYRLGILYYNGEGVAQDKKMAAKLYQQAADQGSPYAQYSLGTMYQDGDGVAQDYTKAALYYQQSANGGDSDGMVGLGILYRHGYGVSQDLPRAVDYYTQAVKSGDTNGAYDLGLLYYSGGPKVPQDLIKAYAWFATADAMTPNDADTARLKGEVFALLPPADQATAKTLATQYISTYARSSQ